MNMQTWAEREIEIACKRERADSKVEDGNWDYVCACYESALKAYKSLMGDGHSGFSIGLTKQILNRLIEGKPLTPIEDTDDIWNDLSRFGDGDDKYTSYQCKRMSSLFKYVYADGTIKYKDIDGHYCINVDNPNSTYHSGLVQRIIDEMFPITMPYFPKNPIKVYCEDFLVDKRNGDFDTRGVFYLVKSDGERMEINRFFKSTEEVWDEIDEVEYLKRKSIRIKELKMKIQDSGMRREFETGAVRDVAKGKGRCDLLPLGILSIYLDFEILKRVEQYIRSGDIEYLEIVLNIFSKEKYTSREEMILEVSKQYEAGAEKYNDRNWEKGIPIHCYIDSAVRHYLKWRRGDKDETHDRAFVWNILGAIWTHINRPEMIDLPFVDKKIDHATKTIKIDG